jgi:glycosyltransferase involved in cell wall biosynthesis
LHVGLFIYDTLQKISGGYLYDRTVVDYLRTHGDTVSVISLPWRSYTYHLMDNFSYTFLKKLTRMTLDILIEDELNHPSCFLLNHLLRERITYPIITIVHHLRSLEQHQPWQLLVYRWVEQHYLSCVDGFICNSKDTQHAVERLTGHETPSIVAYPGGNRFAPTITEADIVRRAQQGGPLRLLFLGNVIPRKGLHMLLDALKELPTTDWILTVVGSVIMDEPYARTMVRCSHKFGHRVQFVGSVNDRELARYLETSHVLVVPSSYEGFGIVYLEAMGFGMPAIASARGGAQEIITHGEDGFLVEPDDRSSLSHYVHTLCHDRKRLIAMSLAARRCYATFPTWSETAARIQTFLHSFVNAHDRGRIRMRKHMVRQ